MRLGYIGIMAAMGLMTACGTTSGIATLVKHRKMWMTTTTSERVEICTNTVAIYHRDVHDHLHV